VRILCDAVYELSSLSKTIGISATCECTGGDENKEGEDRDKCMLCVYIGESVRFYTLSI